MHRFCCEQMKYHATYKCDMHENVFDCPDNIIYFDENRLFNDIHFGITYGIIIHDSGSFVKIKFCPWCGEELLKDS